MNRCFRRLDGGTERMPVCVERTRDGGPFGPPHECPGTLEGGGLNVACDGPEDCPGREACIWQAGDGAGAAWCSEDPGGELRVCQEAADCEGEAARCIPTEELFGELYETEVGVCLSE